MENVSSGSSLDFSLMLSLDMATPEQLERLFEPIGSQDSSTAGGLSVVQQAEVFARQQVRVATPCAGSSYRLSHYDPVGNEGQVNNCLNTVKASPVKQLSPQLGYLADPDCAGLPSINYQEPGGNCLSGAINHKDSERRVTSYPPDYPAKARSADRFSSVMFGLQNTCAAGGQSVDQQAEFSARHQVRVAAPCASASYRLSHYDPLGYKGQMNDCQNTLQAPPVKRLSSQPVFKAGHDGAGLPSISQREPESNWLSGAINHNDSEARVTSYPPDYPAKASSADRFSPVMRTHMNRFAWRPWCKAAMQVQRIDNPRHAEVIAALRYKILSRSFDKSNRPVAQRSSRSLMAPGNPKTLQ